MCWGGVALHAVEVGDDIDYPYAAHLRWRLERAWADVGLGELEATLPGEPCILQPPAEHPDIAEITMRIAEVSDLQAAAQVAHAQVTPALRRQGSLGQAVDIRV